MLAKGPTLLIKTGFDLLTIAYSLQAGLPHAAVERAVIPVGLSVLESPRLEKDMFDRWKPEGSDTYARCYIGRVARLQAAFATAARSRDYFVMSVRS